VELGGQLESFRKQGLEVAAVSYDSPEVLRHFAASRGIGFPLLADPASEVIRRFGLAQDNGAAYATTFVTDAQGVVRARYTEDSIVFRRTGGSLLVRAGLRPDGAEATRTDHFTLWTSSSNPVVGPGQRFTLVLDFEVEPDHHLYAPGVAGGYRALSVQLEPHPRVLRIDAPQFPRPRPYLYQPLNETVPIFEGRFRVTVDVTMNDTNVGWAQDRLDDPARYEPVELRGTLGYQVCSHTRCYPPATLPLRFAVKLRPKDERRAPVEMRKPRSS
jgi:AhpC/TSA family protein/cytochrome c biogenesis DsbD-like protein